MPASGQHIYRVSPRRLMIAHGLMAFFLLIPVAVIAGGLIEHDSKTVEIGLVLACMLGAMAALIAYLVRYPALIAGPEGITVRFYRLKLSAPWENIERIRPDRGTEGFILREPLKDKAADYLRQFADVYIRGVPMYTPEQSALLHAAMFIPIEAYAWRLEHDDLLEVIRHYRPDLATGFQRDRQAAKPMEAAQKKEMFRIYAFCAVLAMGGIAAAFFMDKMPPATQRNAEFWIDWIQRIFFGFMAVLLAFTIPRNVLFAIKQFREGRPGLMLLWLFVAVVQCFGILLLLAIAFQGHNHP